ncbi:MAG: cupredoxin domain-containing protein [Candidatus Aenigmarchaeota archaeon]|nr:cupredoxin domain-containing protein [Candidatus Aenigmarchaeota archaeon]
MKIMILAAIIGLVAVAGCTGQSTDTTTTTLKETTTTLTATTGATTTSLTGGTTSTTKEVTVIEKSVTGSSFKFEPSTISVKKGDRVKIRFVSADVGHNLMITGYGQTKVISSGAAAETIEFTADKAGTFEYYCSVGSHKALGMKGTLTVT